MNTLRLKKEAKLKAGETYSICLRGARRYDIDEVLDILSEDDPSIEKQALIISQNHYVFVALENADCKDNYDKSIKTYVDLRQAMKNIYSGFEPREVVTLLRFKIL